MLEPPYEKSGSVTPTTGRTPTVMPMLKMACQKNIAPTPTATRGTEAILRVRGDADRPDADERVEHRAARCSRRSPSPRRTRGTESPSTDRARSRTGSACPRMKPLAPEPAVADGRARLMRVPARAGACPPPGSGSSGCDSSGSRADRSATYPRRRARRAITPITRLLRRTRVSASMVMAHDV